MDFQPATYGKWSAGETENGRYVIIVEQDGYFLSAQFRPCSEQELRAAWLKVVLSGEYPPGYYSTLGRAETFREAVAICNKHAIQAAAAGSN